MARRDYQRHTMKSKQSATRCACLSEWLVFIMRGCSGVLCQRRMHTPPGGSKDQWRMKGIVGSDLLKYPCGTGAHPRALKHAAR